MPPKGSGSAAYGGMPPVVKDRRTKISYGSDFTGIGTTGIALRKLNNGAKNCLKIRHVFASDLLRCAKTFIMYNDPPEQFDKDVMARRSVPIPAGELSLYVFTAPCQGLSQAGLMQGASDPRTRLMFRSLAFLEKERPKCFMAENVSNLAVQENFKPLFEFLLKKMKEYGYYVEWKLLNSNEYVPQNRMRLYILGIRTDCKRVQTRGIPFWGSPPEDYTVPSIQSLIPSKVGSVDYTPLPNPKEGRGLLLRNVMRAYKECEMNPFTTPILVDMKASPKFSTWRHGESPTLTQTRASSFGYWYSLKGGPLSVGDMAKLQGFKGSDFPWKESQMGSETAVAGVLGNGQTLPLVQNLLPNLLWHASLVSYETFLALEAVPLR